MQQEKLRELCRRQSAEADVAAGERNFGAAGRLSVGLCRSSFGCLPACVHASVDTVRLSQETATNAAISTYATITADETFVACKNTLDALYTTKSSKMSLKGVRACEYDDENSNEAKADPCCNDALRSAA